MLEIERLRQFNESKEHWQVRKEFLVKNWEGRKSTDSLVSLSWCYSNMMVLGANYPPETIAKINEMLPQQHRTSSSEPKQNAKVETVKNETKPTPFSLIPSRKRRRKTESPKPEVKAEPKKPTTVLEISQAQIDQVQIALREVDNLESAVLRSKLQMRYDSYQVGYDDTYDELCQFYQQPGSKLNEQKQTSLDSDEWVSIVYVNNIELGFGIGINQSRANAEARKCAEIRIHEKCVIGTRLRNNLKIRQVTMGTEDHLDLGYLCPKPTDCHSDGSLSCLTRHITEKSKEKPTAEFLALVQRENQLEMKMKQEMTQREEIRTKLYIGNILVAESLGPDKQTSETKAKDLACIVLKTCQFAPHVEETIDLTDEVEIVGLDLDKPEKEQVDESAEKLQTEEDLPPLWITPKVEKYEIPTKRRKLLKDPIEFIKGQVEKSGLTEGSVVEPKEQSKPVRVPPPSWLKPRLSKYEKGSKSEFSLKLAEKTVAQWDATKKSEEKAAEKESSPKKPTLDDLNAKILEKRLEEKKKFAFVPPVYDSPKPIPAKSSEKSDEKPKLSFGFGAKPVEKSPPKLSFGFGQKPSETSLKFSFDAKKESPKSQEKTSDKPKLSFGFGQKPKETTLKFSFEAPSKPATTSSDSSVKMPNLSNFLKPLEQPITDDEKHKISTTVSDSDSDSFSSDSESDCEPILITINNDQTKKEDKAKSSEKSTKLLSERSHFKSGKGIKLDLESSRKLEKKPKKPKHVVKPEIMTKIDNLQKILRSYPASFDSLPKAARDIDEQIEYFEFNIQGLLADFEKYFTNDVPRLNQARFGDLKSSYACCLVKICDVEIGLGVGKDKKRARGEALASADAKLRYTKQYVVYAARYAGVKKKHQLTISPSKKHLDEGFLPPIKADEEGNDFDLF